MSSISDGSDGGHSPVAKAPRLWSKILLCWSVKTATYDRRVVAASIVAIVAIVLLIVVQIRSTAALDSACYYTFSTVCQTLAGAFGFLVAIALYRVQGIDQMLYNNCLSWTAGWGLLEVDSLRLARDWPRIAEMLRKIENPPQPGIRAPLDISKAKFLSLVGQLQAVKDDLRHSLELTGLTIGVSLVMIPLTPLIACYRVPAGILMLADVAMAAWCIHGYYELAKGAAE